jgi:hypothetical protein
MPMISLGILYILQPHVRMHLLRNLKFTQMISENPVLTPDSRVEVALLYPRSLDSLSVVSYDSRGLRWRYSNPPPHGNRESQMRQ